MLRRKEAQSDLNPQKKRQRERSREKETQKNWPKRVDRGTAQKAIEHLEGTLKMNEGEGPL